MRDTDKAPSARLRTKLGISTTALALVAALALAPSALATPIHPRDEARDVSGLNHACGAAVDSKGDLYLASAGTSEVKVYNAAHTLLTSIADANQPCGLAVTATGNLYVSERASGEVVRFKPNAYPFAGTPTYGSREVIDASGVAAGIAVDRFDDRLYVAEGSHVSVYEADGTSAGVSVGEGVLTEATGVAAYTYPTANSKTDRYLSVADAAGLGADRLYIFSGPDYKALKQHRELTATPDGPLGFGPAGAYLAADPGNRASDGKCPEAAAQACTAGHLFLYDSAHKALDEFDATGEYLGQTKNAAFADAEPTAVAIDRSGGAGDGTAYVTAGAGAGAKALAFAPLKAPARATLGTPLSKVLIGAKAVATDSYGDVYVASGAQVHVYKPDGGEILTPASKPLLPDSHKAKDLAVDSTGKVYVLDENNGFSSEAEVTYYTPSAYPPVETTTYSRHEPVIATPKDWPVPANTILKGIAVNPGPGPGKDRLFVTDFAITHLYDSAANGSGLLDSEFAKDVGGIRESIAVNGANGNVYIGTNPSLIYGVDKTGKEILARIQDSCPPSGKFDVRPFVAVDQANGHVLQFDGKTPTAREYDAAGSCVAEFGKFTEGLVRPYRVAVDSSCALHEPPLTGSACEAYDPANGNAYVAFDDTSPTNPPYDLTAFGPLKYATASPHKLTVKKTGTGSGKVTSSPAGIDCGGKCSAEFEEGGIVTLVATPVGSEFIGWTGCEAETVSPTEGTCEVSPTKDREVVAEFKKGVGPEFTLTVKKSGVGAGEVSSEPAGIECGGKCSADFSENTEVRLTATPEASSEFTGWGAGDCETETVSTFKGTCVVTMTEAKEVTAEFDVEHPLLTVVKKGAGTGTVTSEPPGIDCGSTCSHKFDLGDKVKLKAAADEGSEFTGWSGSGCSGTGTCEVTMSGAKEVTATFIALPKAIAKQPQIAYDEATLRGEVDPAGLATKYHFEYLTEAEYEANGNTFAGAQSTPVVELAAAAGFVAVEAPLVGLKEGTEYRFLLHAVNSVGPAEDERSFETLLRRPPESCPNTAFRFGLSAGLPDCRAYELVTPAETNGALLTAPFRGNPTVGFNNWLAVPRGTSAGEAFSFESTVTLPGFDGSGIIDGYRSERGSGPHPEGGWNTKLVSPSYLQGGGIANGADALNGSPDQLYSFWQVTPKYSFEGGLPAGTYLRTPSGFEVVGQGSLGADLDATSQYASAGGAHILFSSTAHLEPAAAPSGTGAIYDRKAGSASAAVVSVKPGGSSFSEGAAYLGATEDGSAVAFKVGGDLYLHREGETTEIATASNTYAGISSDGTRVFYADAASQPAGLFVCDTATGPCAGTGSHAPTQVAANNATFVNVSADGSHAFFTSTDALTLSSEENENHEHAEATEHNLYSWDGAGVHFIAILDPQDVHDFGGVLATHIGAWTEAIAAGSDSGFVNSPARSTPGGGAFVFQSHAQLGPYDNEGLAEIYRYAPAAPGGEHLSCVSCDPSGAPPSADATLESTGFSSSLDVKTVIPNVTDGGATVFFQSPDRLLPEDANEAEDVYEWRASGSGSCIRPGGCLALISSGQGEGPSFLYAMSADGRDVFFRTQEKLVGADVPGSFSVYDAREGGGIPEPTPAAPCQGDACQGTGTEPPTIPAPATTGAGEEAEAEAKPQHCGKGRHRVKGRCVKRHHRKKHHRAHANRGGHR